MNTNKPLIVSKRDKIKGLFTYCQKCKSVIENRKCKKTGKRLSTCKNTDQHVFKAIICIPGTSGAKRKTKVLRTRDIHEASRLKNEFVRGLEYSDYQNSDALIEEELQKPNLLIECMTMYIGYLNNEGVEAHKIKLRSDAHIKDVERFFKYFCMSLKSNNIDHTLVKIDNLNDKIVALLHNYIIDTLEYENKTYNKFIGTMRQFVSWLTNEKDYQLKNPFVGVTRRPEIIDKTIVSKSEFKKLLDSIDPDKGYKTFPSGERKNFYRSWLSSAFKLALETGLRREEFMSIKFNDIITDKIGSPLFIKVENFKVNRSKGVSGTKNASMKHIPITKGLRGLLNELDYNKNKEKEKYLIGSEETTTLKTRIDVVSKSFSLYWKLTGIEKTAQLKHLRKTYLTSLVEQFGEKATLISSHSGMEVLKKHYVNDQQLMLATNNFSVFK